MLPYASLLIKPASGSCNMACRYCFYRDVSERREVPNLGRMSDVVMERLICRALEESERGCSFAFQGGEPTLAGLDFFRRFVETVRAHNQRNLPVQYAIQTNGLLIDDEWAAFFARERFLVGVSLDGDRETHNAARVTAQDKGTFDAVLRSIDRLRRAGVDFNILCVVTSYTARHAERLYRFFRRQGFDYLQFIPCLDSLEEERGGYFWSLTPERYASFLTRTFDLWYAEMAAGKRVSVRNFDNWLGILLGQPPENCAMSGRCAAYFVVEADGSVYPCDFYVTDAWRLGNLANQSLEQLRNSPTAMHFEAQSTVPADCRACQWYPLCRGGCRRDRELPDGRVEANVFCSAYQTFFAHAAGRLQQLAQQLSGRR